MTERICILGNGCAAVEACRGLRESGFRGGVDVFAAGNLPVYNPMLTSYYAAGKIGYPLLFPYGDSNAVFEKYEAALHPDSPVTTLSAAKRTITAGGREIPFGKCCIATGAAPVVPPIPGARAPGVFTMRTVEDAVAVKEAMTRGPKKALVVGASMVGIKLVELFWKAGLEVTLADMADRIFPLAAHPDCSRVIEDRLKEMGVRLRFSAALEGIDETADGLSARFKGADAPLDVEIIVLAIGVRANLGFVDRGEIDVGQGVLVDEYMESNVPGIYAAGDCAQGKNILTGEKQIIGLWANARNQGFAAGCNMAGANRRLDGEILHNITHFMGMDFVGLGDVGDANPHTTTNEKGLFKQVFYKDGQICGANFIDFYENAGVFKNVLVKRNLLGKSAEAATSSGVAAPLQEYLFAMLT